MNPTRSSPSCCANGPPRDATTRCERAAGRGRRGRTGLGGDNGAVTVEAALALATLTVFVAMAVGALVAVIQSVRCVDAARELARLAARGEPDRGREVARQLAPTGARLELTDRDGTLVAVVTAPLVGLLPVTVSGQAVAAREDTADPAPDPDGRPVARPP